jgi:CrcB protein
VNEALLVAVGAVPGSWLRLRLVNHFEPLLPHRHWATLAVNVSASFALGLVVALDRSSGTGSPLLLLIGTGFLGSFSTFSTFMLEALLAWQAGRRRETLALLAASVLLGVLAVLLGQAVARA